MRKNISGFTLVELLIVIVVIGILAAISLVAYNGVQAKALNASRQSEVHNWTQLISLYVAQNGSLPANVAAGNYCLGTGFPNGNCRNYNTTGQYTYAQSDNQTLMQDFQTVGSLPGGTRQPVDQFVGPYINIWPGGSGYSIIDFFSGGASDCPLNMTYSWDDGSGAVMCDIDVSLPG
ncbi:MAG TPA: prepilin-type N-terminal cleavage/methylation domain-containing protein [Candidatus Saccharimonadaceae bacterium]|nr:prepilin-type N-terminal cleavage/methylation domain-containing protein [Candidatus Saccharimonadaceae bacterium]